MQQDKTSKLLLQIAILGLVAIILAVALFYATSSRSATAGPRAQIASSKKADFSSYSQQKPEEKNLITSSDLLDEEVNSFSPANQLRNTPAFATSASYLPADTRNNKHNPTKVTPLLLPGQNSQSYTSVLDHNKPARTMTSRPSPLTTTPGKSRQPNEQKTAISDEFAPYMASLNKEQAEALEKQLNGLSDRVEAAILRALLPKSKKDMNIEKYLSHNSSVAAEPSSSGDGKFVEVANQMVRQKAAIMASMKQAFGNRAANEAGQIMNSYQNEIMQLLNQQGLTPEQIQQKARQISNKYNKQLQQVSEKNALQQIKEERLKQDNALQNNLEQAYGSDMAKQLGDILDKYRQKDFQLAQRKDLTEEEYYNQLFDNRRQRRKELEEALVKNGKSLQDLLNIEDQMEAENLSQLQQLEEQGNLIPQVYRLSKEQKDAFNNSIEAERQDKLQAVRNAYGEKGVALINEAYDEYAKEVNEIISDEHTSQLEKNRLLEEARQRTNESLQKIQNRTDMKQLLENNQVETSLAEIMKDPAFAQATEQQRKQFEEHARPILHDMFARINELIANPNLTDAQKEQQIQAIQQDAHQKLSGQ